MSEPDETNPPQFELDAFVSRFLREQDEYRARAARFDPANKKALFDALGAAGISHVIVSFDGYGDSGQIESIDAWAGDASMALPVQDVTLVLARWDNAEVKAETMSVESAIEHMVYEYLERTHSGWENNDGADGEFMFSVVNGTVTLDYNEHYTASENYTHEF